VFNNRLQVLGHKRRRPILLAGLLFDDALPDLPERAFGHRRGRLVVFLLVERGDGGQPSLQGREAEGVGAGPKVEADVSGAAGSQSLSIRLHQWRKFSRSAA
jgi:hypothetical protein